MILAIICSIIAVTIYLMVGYTLVKEINKDIETQLKFINKRKQFIFYRFCILFAWPLCLIIGWCYIVYKEVTGESK